MSSAFIDDTYVMAGCNAMQPAFFFGIPRLFTLTIRGVVPFCTRYRLPTREIDVATGQNRAIDPGWKWRASGNGLGNQERLRERELAESAPYHAGSNRHAGLSGPP